MPLLLADSTDWESRESEARLLAGKERDPNTAAWLRQVAAEYERLARLTAERRATNSTQ